MAGADLLHAVEGLAGDRPEAVAQYHPVGRGRYEAVTYHRLREGFDYYAAALARAGVVPGMRACLMVPPGPDLTAVMGALTRLGAVPVLIDPGLAPAAVRSALAETRPQAFIGVAKAHVARLLLGWGRGTVRLPLLVGAGPAFLGAPLRRLRGTTGISGPSGNAEGREAPGLVAFTSGSTGPPKPASYNPGNLMAQFRMAGHMAGLPPGTVALSTLPPFSLAGSAMGLSMVVPDMNFLRPASADPAVLAGEICRFDVAAVFASPVVLERLSAYCAQHSRLLKPVRTVLSGGASLAPRTAEKLLACLPAQARLLSCYGATESMPISVLGHHDLLGDARCGSRRGWGSCVGVPLPDNNVRIIRIANGPIAEWDYSLLVAPGEIGEITVAGPGTSSAYDGQPQNTALAKIRDGKQIVHRMGDAGRFDEQGRLWFCGRVSQRVRTAHGEVFTEQAEAVANTVPGVRRCGLVGTGPAGTQLPVLCVETERRLRGAQRRKAVTDTLALMQGIPHLAGIKQVLFHPGLPVDIRHNSKINHPALAVWAARKIRG
ncbi:fatty acid CoA ligase family protein [Streptosporangium nondiastaticum]|nr:fatty acid CoA ligase family protein [Streptosporangium nondiastaticum]